MPQLDAMAIRDFPSPNFGARRDGASPDIVVLHYTGMATADAARARLCDPAAEVSSHYLVDMAGRIDRLVPEDARAWHAGAGAWGGVSDVNSRSIGIEIVNMGDHAFPEAQYRSLENLLDAISGRWGIRPDRVIGHSDMAPDRKMDPGPRFDWRRLARAKRSVWADGAHGPVSGPQSGEPDWARFMRAARRFGYVAPNGADPQIAVLRAFRLRFRPFALDEPLCSTDLQTIESLAEQWPGPGS